MIYLKLSGRLGNQLFMYATARMIQELKGGEEEIIIEDYGNTSPEGISYENSLVNYSLHHVRFIHDLSLWNSVRFLPFKIKWKIICNWIERDNNENHKYRVACKKQGFYNRLGVFHMQDGYVPYPKRFTKDTLVVGYFQSEKYFQPIAEEIKETFRIREQLEKYHYPNLDLIKERNTVCISIKVQHNAGNYMYDVCDEAYYTKAIAYIKKNVENPLFFICSDNVEYVKEHFIDTSKYDVVEQDVSAPIHISLAAMAACKHYIIGNTSFGWWAQYLSVAADKIVIVPSKWYNGMDDWQYDIYQDNWIRIDV